MRILHALLAHCRLVNHRCRQCEAKLPVLAPKRQGIRFVQRCSRVHMTMTQNVAAPDLDKSQFDQTIPLHALRVLKNRCGPLLSKLKGVTFHQPRLRTIAEDPTSPDHRLILLDPTLHGLPMQQVLATKLKDKSTTLASVVAEEDGAAIVEHQVHVGYNYWSSTHVLKHILPEGTEVPTSFETVGHIAHLNLRDEMLPWKHIIGQVILDKNPNLKTVVNKVGTIENEYRVFAMEVLAGQSNLITEVKQHGARFKLDFSKVYWNSRLEQEHVRLVERYFKVGDVIVDVMAGIGPFAIPAAKHRGCTVLANDLNPDSVMYLRENMRINKVADRVVAYNMDGRAFIRAVGGNTSPSNPPADPPPSADAPSDTPSPVIYQHAVMNLPASAIEFVDAFHGAFDATAWEGRPLPMVHCYAFQRVGETEQDLLDKLQGYLGGRLDTEPAVHLVRSVAPNKDMVCISFVVPRAVAFGRENKGMDDTTAAKRQKVT